MLKHKQESVIGKRFRHYDHDACTPLFSQDQEEDWMVDVRDQGQFPGIRMANGATWFYDREQRPRRFNGEGRDVGPMKTKAPAGERRLLCSDPEAPELLFVEGEGDAVALVSVGATGVVACGGVNVFQSRAGWATEMLRQLVDGKRVRIAFDFDRAGQRAAVDTQRRLLQVGATRVAALPPQEDWEDGWDIEDWLGSFDTRGEAYWQLMQRLTSLPWGDEATQAADEEAEEALPERPVTSERIPIPGTGRKVLVTAVHDKDADTFRLAVHAPENLLDGSSEQPGPSDSVRHDAEPSDHWDTQVMESWLHDGERYVPPGGDVLDEVRAGAVTAPSPPSADVVSHEMLWRDVVDFLKRWLLLKDVRCYLLIAAWVLLSYRLNDLQSRFVPLLRFTGPPASGKGTGLTLVHSLSFWSRMLRWTPDNLHRVADAYRDGVLLFDELHLDRGRSQDAQQRMADAFSNAFDRFVREARFEGTGIGVRTYGTFAMAGTAGYEGDEHQGIGRRSITVPMEKVDIPLDRQYLEGPARRDCEARDLRRQLLTWRFQCSAEEKPDEEGSVLANRVKEVAGTELGQAFWPIVQMVPPECSDDLDSIFDYVKDRRRQVKALIQREACSHILMGLGELINDGTQVLSTEHGVRISMQALVDRCRSDLFPAISSQKVHQELERAAGIKKQQLRVRKHEEDRAAKINLRGRYPGIEVDLRDGSKHRDAFEAHGVELTPWCELQERLGGAPKRLEGAM